MHPTVKVTTQQPPMLSNTLDQNVYRPFVAASSNARGM